MTAGRIPVTIEPVIREPDDGLIYIVYDKGGTLSDEQKDLARAMKLIEWLDAERKTDKALIAELGRQLEVLSLQVREQGALLRQTQENLDQTTSLARKTLRLEEALKQAHDRIELLQQRMDEQERLAGQATRLREVEEERQRKAFVELQQRLLALEEDFQEGRATQFQEARLEAARQSIVQLEQRTTALEHDGESSAARLRLAEENLARLLERMNVTALRMDEVDRAESERQAQFKAFEDRSRRSVEAAAIAQKLAEEIREQNTAILARTKLVEEQGRRAEAQTARIEALETWRLQQQKTWGRWEERALDWTNQIIALQEQMAERRRYNEQQDQQWREFMDQYKLHRDEVAQALEQERSDRRAQDAETLTQIDKWRAQVQEEFVETRRQLSERISHEHQLWTDWLRYEIERRGPIVAEAQAFAALARDLLRGVPRSGSPEQSEET